MIESIWAIRGRWFIDVDKQSVCDTITDDTLVILPSPLFGIVPLRPIATLTSRFVQH